MKKVKENKPKKEKISFIGEYLSFLKLTFKTYDPPIFVLNFIALVLFSFGLWYRDLVNIVIAIGFWLLCHIYTFVSTKIIR